MISRDPDYVGRAKAIRSLETKRREQFASGQARPVQTGDAEFDALLEKLTKTLGCPAPDITFGGLIENKTDRMTDLPENRQQALRKFWADLRIWQMNTQPSATVPI